MYAVFNDHQPLASHSASSSFQQPADPKETFEGAQLDLTDSPLHTVQWARVILDEAELGADETGFTESRGPRLDQLRLSVLVD